MFETENLFYQLLLESQKKTEAIVALIQTFDGEGKQALLKVLQNVFPSTKDKLLTSIESITRLQEKDRDEWIRFLNICIIASIDCKPLRIYSPFTAKPLLLSLPSSKGREESQFVDVFKVFSEHKRAIIIWDSEII